MSLFLNNPVLFQLFFWYVFVVFVNDNEDYMNKMCHDDKPF